jgi:C1A family cysteine protease
MGPKAWAARPLPINRDGFGTAGYLPVMDTKPRLWLKRTGLLGLFALVLPLFFADFSAFTDPEPDAGPVKVAFAHPADNTPPPAVKTYGWMPPQDDPHPSTSVKAKLRMVAPAALPASVDLRPRDVPIYNQGQLGSCTGNGWAGICQYRKHNEPVATAKLSLWDRALIFARVRKRPVPPKPDDAAPSRLFIYYNERDLEGTTGSDSGAAVADGGKVVSTLGVPPESAWPYSDSGSRFRTRPPASAYQAAKRHVTPPPSSVDTTDLAEVKRTLSQGHPIVFGFIVYRSFESIGPDGVYQPAGRVVGGHCVEAVGYDDASSMIIVRNSWGTQWGDRGYFYMPYSVFADSRQVSDAWTIVD